MKSIEKLFKTPYFSAALIFAILFVSVLFMNAVLGWTNPSATPPTGGGLLTGTIMMYGAGAAPTGWLNCDGSPVSRVTYANLFTIIGTTYGSGDGVTTFNLPDFRGVFPKGAGATSRTAGVDALGNFYSGVLGSYAQDHAQGSAASAYTFHESDGTRSPGFDAYSPNSSPTYGGTIVSIPQSTDGTHGTPRVGNTTEPQSLSVNFIIKY